MIDTSEFVFDCFGAIFGGVVMGLVLGFIFVLVASYGGEEAYLMTYFWIGAVIGGLWMTGSGFSIIAHNINYQLQNNIKRT